MVNPAPAACSASSSVEQIPAQLAPRLPLPQQFAGRGGVEPRMFGEDPRQRLVHAPAQRAAAAADIEQGILLQQPAHQFRARGHHGVGDITALGLVAGEGGIEPAEDAAGVQRLQPVAVKVVAVAPAVAEDLNPPPWRGEWSTTSQVWEFLTDDQGPLPPDGPATGGQPPLASTQLTIFPEGG